MMKELYMERDKRANFHLLASVTLCLRIHKGMEMNIVEGKCF